MSKKVIVMLVAGMAILMLLGWVVMTQGPLASVKVTTRGETFQARSSEWGRWKLGTAIVWHLS